MVNEGAWVVGTGNVKVLCVTQIFFGSAVFAPRDSRRQLAAMAETDK